MYIQLTITLFQSATLSLVASTAALRRDVPMMADNPLIPRISKEEGVLADIPKLRIGYFNAIGKECRRV